MAAGAPGRRAVAVEPAVLDRRRAVLDGDGAARRRRSRATAFASTRWTSAPAASRRRVRGVYGRNSFRGHDLAFRDRYFDATPDGYRLQRRPSASRCAFSRATCSPPTSCRARRSTTSIFCRNVLIYFDRPTQDRALGVLNRLLHADGRAVRRARRKPACCASHDFVSTKEPLAFAFRKAGARPPRSRNGTAAARRSRSPPPLPVAPARLASARAAGVAPPARRQPPRRCAGSGRPARPRAKPRGSPIRDTSSKRPRCCEEHLRRYGPSATAFYLLGLVRDATGNHAEAADLLPEGALSRSRSPRHADPSRAPDGEAGRHGGAQVLRNRARRLEQKRKADMSEPADTVARRSGRHRRLLEPHRRARRRIVPRADGSTFTAATARCTPPAPRDAARRRRAGRLPRRPDGAFRRSRRTVAERRDAVGRHLPRRRRSGSRCRPPVVIEVANLLPIHSLPHRPNGVVLGLASVRGELLVCVSLGQVVGAGAARGGRPRARRHGATSACW